MAAEKTYNDLDVTLKKANEHRNEWFEGVHKCKLDETLFTIMEKIVRAEVIIYQNIGHGATHVSVHNYSSNTFSIVENKKRAETYN